MDEPTETAERDLNLEPYSRDEQRVVHWLLRRTKEMIGAGDDPIGFLLASYEFMMSEKGCVTDDRR